MKRAIIVITVMAWLGLAGVAAAQNGRDSARGHSATRYSYDSSHRSADAWHGNGYGRAQPYSSYRGYPYARTPYAVHSWYRGDRLPATYWSRNYWVADYPHYHLYAPPYGQQWVRVNNDLLLTALATGLVLDVVYNLGR